jgi:hypothetical protein
VSSSGILHFSSLAALDAVSFFLQLATGSSSVGGSAIPLRSLRDERFSRSQRLGYECDDHHSVSIAFDAKGFLSACCRLACSTALPPNDRAAQPLPIMSGVTEHERVRSPFAVAREDTPMARIGRSGLLVGILAAELCCTDEAPQGIHFQAVNVQTAVVDTRPFRYRHAAAVMAAVAYRYVDRAQTDRSDSKSLSPTRRGVIHRYWRHDPCRGSWSQPGQGVGSHVPHVYR